MKIKKLLGTALGILLVAGRIPSLNPFYTEKDLVFESRLIGEWQSKDSSDPQRWTFERAGDKGYKLVVTDKQGKKGILDARLFKLKDETFLDLTPGDCEFAPTQADIVAAGLIPGHLLVRVPRIDPVLRLAFCDYDWLGKYLESHPKALAFHNEEKHGAIIAPTKDLQAFVMKHLGEMFQQPVEFERQSRKNP